MWWFVNIKLKVTFTVKDGTNVFRNTVYIDTGKTREERSAMTPAQWREHVRKVGEAWELANVTVLYEGEVYG